MSDIINAPGFDIIEKIGEGESAVVWKARQLSLNRLVAIKVLKRQLSSDPDQMQDVIKEARSAAGLKHPHILPIYDVAEHDGDCYFVLEYVAGSTVGRMLEEDGSIPAKEALKIVIAAAGALECAWNESGIIHRGIKPDNIMIDEDGTVKLSDLGLAKMTDPVFLAVQVNKRNIECAVNYISPEQARCSIRLDYRTDMYSLGATLYHMVTGTVPFEEYEPAQVLEGHIIGHLSNPRDVKHGISITLSQVITKLMMKKPDDRYDDWSQAVLEMKKAVSGRILVGKHDTGAVSTIEPQIIKGPDTDRHEKTPTAISLWIRLPAWILLLVWWIVLAYKLVN